MELGVKEAEPVLLALRHRVLVIVMLPLALREPLALPQAESVGVLDALKLPLPVPLAERHCVGVMLRVREAELERVTDTVLLMHMLTVRLAMKAVPCGAPPVGVRVPVPLAVTQPVALVEEESVGVMEGVALAERHWVTVGVREGRGCQWRSRWCWGWRWRCM